MQYDYRGIGVVNLGNKTSNVARAAQPPKERIVIFVVRSKPSCRYRSDGVGGRRLTKIDSYDSDGQPHDGKCRPGYGSPERNTEALCRVQPSYCRAASPRDQGQNFVAGGAMQLFNEIFDLLACHSEKVSWYSSPQFHEVPV